METSVIKEELKRLMSLYKDQIKSVSQDKIEGDVLILVQLMEKIIDKQNKIINLEGSDLIKGNNLVNEPVSRIKSQLNQLENHMSKL